MSRQTGFRILLVSLLALLAEPFLLFPLWFQPSWAKGWPGLSQEGVIAGFCAVLVVMNVQLLVGLTAPLCARLGERGGARNVGWRYYAALAILGVMAGTALGIPAFQLVLGSW